jgi:hypothetical protein
MTDENIFRNSRAVVKESDKKSDKDSDARFRPPMSRRLQPHRAVLVNEQL